MRRTRFGTLLLVAGWACFPLALALHTLAPALLGVLLVALVTGVRAPEVDVRVEREAPERAVAHEPFVIVTRASAAQPVPLFVDEDVPPGVRVLSIERRPARGACETRTTVVSADPGVILWEGARLRFEDAWGVLEAEMRLSLSATTQVSAESSLLAQGKRAGVAMDLGARSRTPRGFDVEPEIERLRDYQAGDRLRDIAWAQVSKLGRLISRELRRESTLPVVILLQAGRSMRWTRRKSKFATCARTALAVLAAAEANGLSAGLVAWSERGVEAQVRVATGRRAVTEAITRLSALPSGLVVEEVPSAAHVAPSALSAAQRDFLALSGAFAPHASGRATPTEAALAALTRVATQPCLVVALVDAEESPELVPTLLERLRWHGHRAVVVAPASGAHHYALRDVDTAVLHRLVRWRRNREEAYAAARRRGAPFLVLGPEVSERSIREVISSTA